MRRAWTVRALHALVLAVLVASGLGTLLPAPVGPLLVRIAVAVVVGAPFGVVLVFAVEAFRGGRRAIGLTAVALLLLVGAGTGLATLLAGAA